MKHPGAGRMEQKIDYGFPHEEASWRDLSSPQRVRDEPDSHSILSYQYLNQQHCHYVKDYPAGGKVIPTFSNVFNL